MIKNSRWMLVLAALAAVLVMGAVAQQMSDDKAIDPVCGMTVVKANAKATFDYKGTTYYFCNPGCKDAFVKDPEKYLKARAEAKAQAGEAAPMGQMGMMKHAQAMGPGMGQGMMGQACPMMQQGGGQGMMGRGGMMRHGRMGMGMGMGMMPGGGMMAPGMGRLFALYGDKIEVTVENAKDGAMLKVTSKDPEVAKAIQVHMAEHMAMMKKMKEAQAKAPAAGAGVGMMGESGCCDGCPMKKK